MYNIHVYVQCAKKADTCICIIYVDINVYIYICIYA